MIKLNTWSLRFDPRLSGVDPLSIREIVLFGYDISDIPRDINWLPECKNLKSLSLVKNDIRRIEGLSELTNLEHLDLSNNKITKIEGLTQNTRLITLRLDRNQISEIEGLSSLKQLTELVLDKNKLSRMRGLDELTELQFLSLWKNDISKIENLEKLSKLTDLYLGKNKINKIENLIGVSSSLETLILSLNKIKKIENLDGLTSLTTLNLEWNNIKFVPNVSVFCPKLRFLRTKGNPEKIVHPRVYNLHQTKFSSVPDSILVDIPSLLRKNIVTLLETDQLTPCYAEYRLIKLILNDKILAPETKNVLVECCSDITSSVSSLSGVKFVDILILVWNRILRVPRVETATEIKRALVTDMMGAECACFADRVSRLINCLAKFFSDIIAIA